MKKLIKSSSIFLLILWFNSSQLFGSNVQNLTIYFDKDKYTINESEKQKLSQISDADLVYIDGFTDTDGSYEYNQKLSQNRAEEIKRLIVSKNPTIRTDLHFYGKTKLKKEELTEEDKKQNRRVEIAFIQNPFLQLKTEVQKFKIDNSKDKTITCKEGTIVEIPQGAFDNKIVDIEISEHYKLENILGENLTTKSNDEALETAGMIKINAKVNGIEAQPTSELTYKFPTKNYKDDFKLFLGTRDKEYNINWTLEQKEEPIEKYTISGSSVATQDISLQSEQFWTSMQDKLHLYEITSPEFLCFNKSKVGVSINPDGLLDTIVTNYPINSQCDKTMKRTVVQNLPKQFSAKERYLYSIIEMEFNDFLPKEIALKHQTMLTKSNNAIDINIYADKKTTILQNAIAEQNRIEQAKEYERQKEEFLKQLEVSNKELYSEQYGLGQYIFTSKNLGWINCDRYLIGTNLMTYLVKTNKDATIVLVSKTYNSTFESKLFNGIHRFNQIPVNQSIVLISSYKKDNQLYLAIKETNTNTKECSDLQYKPVTVAQFKQAVKDIKI